MGPLFKCQKKNEESHNYCWLCLYYYKIFLFGEKGKYFSIFSYLVDFNILENATQINLFSSNLRKIIFLHEVMNTFFKTVFYSHHLTWDLILIEDSTPNFNLDFVTHFISNSRPNSYLLTLGLNLILGWQLGLGLGIRLGSRLRV